MSVERRRIAGLALALTTSWLIGCTSLSGVGGETQYACPAPRGAQCAPVSTNYWQSLRGELPSALSPASTPSVSTNPRDSTKPFVRFSMGSDSDTPSYSRPRVL